MARDLFLIPAVTPRTGITARWPAPFGDVGHRHRGRQHVPTRRCGSGGSTGTEGLLADGRAACAGHEERRLQLDDRRVRWRCLAAGEARHRAVDGDGQPALRRRCGGRLQHDERRRGRELHARPTYRRDERRLRPCSTSRGGQPPPSHRSARALPDPLAATARERRPSTRGAVHAWGVSATRACAATSSGRTGWLNRNAMTAGPSKRLRPRPLGREQTDRRRREGELERRAERTAGQARRRAVDAHRVARRVRQRRRGPRQQDQRVGADQ